MNWFKRLAQEEQGNVYDLRLDGKLLFRGTENECQINLHKRQNQSIDWAMKYEGYTINPITEDWRDHYTWYGGDD